MKIIKVYKSLSAFLFYITLIFIIAGINFSGLNESDRSPGWFIQTLPINDAYNDLFFIDTLNGWMVSTGYPGTSDTGYIIHTSNGGYNWVVQKRETQMFWAVQFLDINTGYVIGGVNGPSAIYKSTNGGNNWLDISSSLGTGGQLQGISFVNKDTGWICSDDLFTGGIYKTTNGGQSWTKQFSSIYTTKICAINNDTAWCSASLSLLRTTNGGVNWNVQYNTVNYPIESIFFLNNNRGWIYAGYKMYSTNGGNTWTNSQGSSGGYDLKFLNENIGYGGVASPPPKIIKSSDGGVNWGYQNTPSISIDLISVLINDTSNAWCGQLMHTNDGGGPIIINSIQQISSTVPDNFKLEQNYPNPFNQCTIINFQCTIKGNIQVKIFDIRGKEIAILVDKMISSGKYEVKFDGGNLPSGVYFYSLFADGVRVDTKKAVLIK